MQQHLEDQKIELEELKKRLRKAYDDMNELRNLYEEQHERNEALLNNGICDLLINKNVSTQSLK